MTKTYLFQPEKKVMKQGFFMTDENGNIVLEAKMLRQPLFGAMDFEFVNHLSGKTTSHKVGKTLTSQTEGQLGSILSTKSRFKFDGKNIWDYLHEEGIRIDSHLQGGKLGMSYEVSLKGQPIASITTSSPKGAGLITTRFFLEVTTDESNLDTAFLTAFAIARTEQTFYN